MKIIRDLLIGRSWNYERSKLFGRALCKSSSGARPFSRGLCRLSTTAFGSSWPSNDKQLREEI